jgi:putative sigma-54 modulation protein
MQVIISTRGVPISATYKDALTRRLGKFERMLPKILEAKIVLSREKHRRTAALTLVAKRHIFRSEETAGDLAMAVDRAIAALGRQVREMKDRLKNRKGRRSPRQLPPVAPEPAVAAPGVEVRRVAVKPMSLAEAVEQFRLAGDEVFLFTNALTDSVNVLYRRRGGGLGLLEPQA